MIFPLRLPLRLTLTAQALASPRQSNPHVDPNGRLKLPSCFGRPDPLVLTLKITSLESSSCHEVDGFPRQQRQQRLGAPLFCGWRRRLSSKHDSGGGANGMFYRPLPAATITRGSAVNKAQAQASPDERDKDVVAAGKGVFGRGVGDNALRSEAVRAYVARKREMLDGHATRRRDLCEKCQRARKVSRAATGSTLYRFVALLLCRLNEKGRMYWMGCLLLWLWCSHAAELATRAQSYAASQIQAPVPVALQVFTINKNRAVQCFVDR